MAAVNKKGLNDYTKEDLQEIHDMFSNDDNYTTLYNIFYNGAKNSQKKSATSLKKNILSTVENLSKEGATVTSPELSNLLISYKNGSPALAIKNSIERRNEAHLRKSLSNLTKIVDSFINNFFKYKTPDNWARILVTSADEDTRKLFADLEKYQLEAKEALIRGQSTKHSLKEIYNGLNSNYHKIIELDFVKAAAKTNRLKAAGFHGKNFATSLLVFGGLGLLAGLLPIAGMPLVGTSASAIFGFIGAQLMPATLIGLGIGATTSIIRQVGMNLRFRKVRSKIRQIDQKDKLFALVQKYTPKNNKELAACAKAFEVELKENIKDRQGNKADIQLGFGLAKRINYKFLLETQQHFQGKHIHFGATTFQDRKKKRLDKQGLKPYLNEASIDKLMDTISISQNSNLSIHLGIKGKDASKTTKKTNSTTTKATKTKSNVVSTAKEDTTKTIIPTEIENKVIDMLKNAKKTLTTAKFESQKSMLEFKIEIEKAKAKSYKGKSKTILETIQEVVDDMVVSKSDKEVFTENGAKITITTSKKKK